MDPRPTEVMVWVLRGLWVTANNLYAIPAMLIWMFLLSPLCLYSPKLFYRIEEVLFSWLHSMVACWTWSAGYQVAESGASLDELKDENLLIMANHQSTADVPVLMTVFSARIGFCNKLMWIMDRVFKFTNFGLVCWMHDDFFILAGKDNRDQTLKDLKQHLKEVFLPKERKYLVLFPEGGFLRKRKEVSHRYAKKLDLPLLEHCTLPRRESHLLNNAMAAFLSGFVVAVVINPFDVISTRIYNQPVSSPLYSSYGDCVSKVVKREGLLAFYKGLTAQYLRIGPHSFLQLILWHHGRRRLGLAEK